MRLDLEFCPRCGSGPRQEADAVECPDCGYLWSGPRLADIAKTGNMLPTHHDVVRELLAIRKYRLTIGDEIQLHRQLEQVIAELLPGEEVKREYSFTPASRIDFYLPRVQVGIEVKVKGLEGDIRNQLERYAACDQVSHLMLIAGRMRLIPAFGRQAFICGKPFTVIPIGGQLL